MSETIHFDTHKFVKRMTETGMSEATAEALADEQLRLIQGELATKTDLAELHAATKRDLAENKSSLTQAMKEMDTRLQAQIKETEAGLRVEIEKTKYDFVRWMAGMFIAQGGVIVALLHLLPA